MINLKSRVLIVTLLFLMVSAQSCKDGGNILQPNTQDEPDEGVVETSLLKESDPETFEKVKNIYGNTGSNGVSLQSNEAGSRTPFSKTLLGELEFENASLVTTGNDDKTIIIPAIKADNVKGKEKVSYRQANLVIKQNNGIRKAQLMVVRSSKKFVEALKKKESISKAFIMNSFTGVIKWYTMSGKQIEDINGMMYKKGKLIKRLVYQDQPFSEKALAGARTSSLIDEEWWSEAWQDVKDFATDFANDTYDCATDGDVLSSYGDYLLSSAACAYTSYQAAVTAAATSGTAYLACGEAVKDYVEFGVTVYQECDFFATDQQY